MPMVNMDEAAAFQRVRDDLPEEERKGNKGKILKYVLELCQSGWSFCQALKMSARYVLWESTLIPLKLCSQK